MYGTEKYPALGSVFRMTESGLLASLEKLSQMCSDQFAIRDTAGIHQLYRLNDVDPIDMLIRYYSEESLGDAA
jgi:hypothetical protein